MKCEYCGTSNLPTARHCVGCAVPLDNTSETFTKFGEVMWMDEHARHMTRSAFFAEYKCTNCRKQMYVYFQKKQMAPNSGVECPQCELPMMERTL